MRLKQIKITLILAVVHHTVLLLHRLLCTCAEDHTAGEAGISPAGYSLSMSGIGL